MIQCIDYASTESNVINYAKSDKLIKGTGKDRMAGLQFLIAKFFQRIKKHVIVPIQRYEQWNALIWC